MFYRHRHYTNLHPASFEAHVNNEIRKRGQAVLENSSGIPRMLVSIEPGRSTVRTLRFVKPCEEYRTLMDSAKQAYETNVEGVASCTQLRYNAAKKTFYNAVVVPNNMFPSKNFRMIKDIISNSIKSCSKLGWYQIVPILINGEPGLGKSKSLDYLAIGSGLSTIRKIDMCDFINHKLSIDTILGQALQDLDKAGNTLILVDELDKYIAGMISFREENITAEHVNQTILNCVLSFIESDTGRKSNTFIMFCSNSFDTIFDNVDRTHYHSLEDRFTKVQYTALDRDEYVQYLRWLHGNLELPGTFDVVYDNEIKDYIYTLDEEFSITYRKLTQAVTRSGFNISKLMVMIHEDYTTPVELPVVPIDNVEIVPVMNYTNHAVSTVTANTINASHRPTSSRNIVQATIVPTKEIKLEEPIVTAEIYKPLYESLLGPTSFTEEQWQRYYDDGDLLGCDCVAMLEYILSTCDFSVLRQASNEHTSVNLNSQTLLNAIAGFGGLEGETSEKMARAVDDLLQYPVNAELFDRVVGKWLLSDEEQYMGSMISAISQRPQWFELTRQYHQGHIVKPVLDYISDHCTHDDLPPSLTRMISYLEIPNAGSLINYHKKLYALSYSENTLTKLPEILASPYYIAYPKLIKQGTQIAKKIEEYRHANGL